MRARGAAAAPGLDGLPDGVVVVDGQRRVQGCNQAFVRMTGFAAETLAGQPLHKVLDARAANGSHLWADGWHASARLPRVRGFPEQEVTVRRADGPDARLLVTGSYERDRDGAVLAATLVARDARRRLGKLASGVEIVSTVSHELRSPLTSVKGYTSLMLKRWDRLADDQKRLMLEQVHHDADRVTRLISELLDISRLESGRLALRCQPLDLRGLVGAVLEKLSLEFPLLEAAVAFDDPFPPVMADPDKVTQVVTNLVENACKYGSQRGLQICGTIEAGMAALSVTDRGEGIPEPDAPRLFSKFFRGSDGRPSGSGLGLWISRGLVEAHGGEMTASSPSEGGATFRFTLPLSGAPAPGRDL
ncbi:MAG: ATP-binding protein [Acidimicrobiales bacterium]